MAKPKSGEQLASLLRKAMELHKLGELARAQTAYAKYLKYSPSDAETQGLLAVLKFQQGHRAGAIELMKRACALAPGEVGLQYNFGNMLFEVGNYREAEQKFRSCLEADPRFALAAANLGAVLMEKGCPDEAIGVFQQAIRLSPSAADYFVNLAMAFTRIYHFREAEETLKLAAELNPADIKIRLALASRLYSNKKLKDTIDQYQAILYRDEGNLAARSGLMMAKLEICDWRDFGQERGRFLTALASVDAAAVVSPPIPYLATLISDDPADCLKAAKMSSATRLLPGEPTTRPKAPAPSEKVRIAYVSADFREHATSHLISEVIEMHDRSRFDVVGISYGPRSTSAMRQRMEAAFDRFVDVVHLSPSQAVQIMRDLEIDIAIDLQGFNQYNRMEIFAQRPAPIQVLYLGWPGTSGAAFYDYILADPIVIPQENFPYFSENVVWLPNSYQANDRRRKVAPGVPTRSGRGLPDDAFVYCCFNNTFKILPEIFDVWMRILGSVPSSVLWLLATREETQDNLRREAAMRNIDPERLVFAPFVSNAEHLARHQHVDLVLDTLPYNAHTTASDALWQGIPVLTCTGASFAGRVATSLLLNCHLPELAVANLADYEALAVRLAREPATLSQLKEKLAGARQNAPLFDSVRFARDIERAFVEMKQHYERGEAPSFLDVRTLA